MRAYHLGLSVLPAAVVGLFAVAAVVVLYNGDPAAQKTRLVLVMAAVGVAITLGTAVLAADAATRRVHRQRAQPAGIDHRGVDHRGVDHRGVDHRDLQRRLGEFGFLIGRGRQDLQELVERLKAGEAAAPRIEDQAAPDTGDPFMQLAYELRKAQSEAWNAVLSAASSDVAGHADQRVDVFVNLARRMQSLSHRAIQGLDELENQVEDPDLLKGLFKVDHLSTRMRRQAESLAVIGGAASRRQWSRPVTTYEVLRSAIAEVEHYNRVKVVPPVDGTLHGSAVADVIHLLAELIENATKFAPPHTQVLVRVDSVAAGLAIEVEDRGLGIPRENQRQLNDLLTDHTRVDTSELLQDGRIGLLVVSALARRHHVHVQLQTNLYGGTQAIVVVPNELVGTEVEASEVRPEAQPALTAPASASAPVPPQAPPYGSGQGIDTDPTPLRNDRDPADVRVAAQPSAAASDAYRAAMPAQQPGPQAAASGSGTGAALTDQAVADQRPALPRRRAQANLAPELINSPVLQQDDQEVEHNPGLMAAFKRGMRSGQGEGGGADGSDSTN